MRLPVARVFLSFLFVLIVGGSVLGGVRVMAQTAPAAASTATLSQADRIAALEKQNADNAALIAAAQTAGDNGWMLVSESLV